MIQTRGARGGAILLRTHTQAKNKHNFRSIEKNTHICNYKNKNGVVSFKQKGRTDDDAQGSYSDYHTALWGSSYRFQ